MGCCFSHENDNDNYKLENIEYTEEKKSNNYIRSKNNDMNPNEKRELAAAAAEARKNHWRQSNNNTSKKVSKDEIEIAKKLRERKEKDALLGRIENIYLSKGKDPPIGLPSCTIDKLKEHLEKIK